LGRQLDRIWSSQELEERRVEEEDDEEDESAGDELDEVPRVDIAIGDNRGAVVT
jgi:hypothetical protein